MSKIFFTPILFLCLFATVSYADGFDRSEATSTESSDPDPIEPGSDASFDKRLPPVLPGERVNDSGRTMKVWSTAGPVPVSRAPEAPQPWNDTDGSSPDNRDISVIVDKRGGRRAPPVVPKGIQEKTMDQQGLSQDP